MVFRGLWILALLIALGLAAAAFAEPSTAPLGAARAALQTPQPLRDLAGDTPVALPPALSLDRRGLSYTHQFHLGGQRLHLRARGPLPRTAARRRFLGVQLELRF